VRPKGNKQGTCSEGCNAFIKRPAEFVLTVGLASARYILDKIEAYIKYNK
jgi:hypothetical protein